MPDQSTSSTYERRLAAIMFTDIVGYTTMMQKDESAAVETIERHREILQKSITYHKGEILQYYGDGSLSVFSSAIASVECAMEIQKELQELQIPLRIGLHLGDVKIRGEAIFGDGVNVASRIQSLGIAGSILISEEILQLTRNQSSFRTVYLGRFNLKNVEEPKTLYALDAPHLSIPKADQLPGLSSGKSTNSRWILASIALIVVIASVYFLWNYFSSEGSVYEDRSIAVLPFNNLSNDPEQEYFSDGITEDVINHLAKVQALKVKSRTTTEQYKDPEKTIPVIGRELGVSYILEGSVRKIDNTVRVVAQLIDVKNDVHMWTETYDRELVEIFHIQSDIAVEIARVLEARLTADERRHIRGGRRAQWRSSEINAYDYLLRARNIWRGWNSEKDLQIALQLIEEAISLDPDFARAYVLKGTILHYGMRDFGVPMRLWIDSARQLADKAILLDSTLADAYLLRGNITRTTDGNSNLAKKDLKKAFYLEPGNPDVLQSLGNYYMNLGEYRKGASLIIRSVERGYSMKDPEYYLRWGNIYARIFSEDAVAEELYYKVISLEPEWIQPYYYLGQLYRYWGKLDHAEEVLSEALEIKPLDQTLFDLLGWVNLQKGDLNDSEKYWGKYVELEQQFADSSQYVPFRHRLGYVKYLKGDSVLARELVEEQRKLDLERHQNLRGYGSWVSRGYFYDLACSNAFLGHRDEALMWLDSAYHQGFINLWYLENDPLLNSIRDEDEFVRIKDDLMERRSRQTDAFKAAIDKMSSVLPEIKVDVQRAPGHPAD